MGNDSATRAGQPLLIVISAPSGAGKTTLCDQLLAARPDLSRAITCTTRRPRAGERDGVDYHFLAPEVFQEQVRAGEFLEHANVFGNHYGTWKSEVLGRLRRGGDVLLNIDVQGAASVRAQSAGEPELQHALVSIFLVPASMEVLAARLRRRGTDAPEVVEARLEVARREVGHWGQFDYLLVSGTIPEDLRRAQTIIEAEKMRSRRAPAPWG